MAQYWTKKNDQEDIDAKAVCSFTEMLLKEDRACIRKIINVVAAVIQDAEGRIFCTQRGYGEFKDGWEFPGGKIEPDELPEEALKREIREELAVEIEVGKLLTTVEYDYPKFHLSMQCFMCTLASNNITLLEHEAACWLKREELDNLNWLPADKEIIELLR